MSSTTVSLENRREDCLAEEKSRSIYNPDAKKPGHLRFNAMVSSVTANLSRKRYYRNDVYLVML